jgi:hypothetical protein
MVTTGTARQPDHPTHSTVGFRLLPSANIIGQRFDIHQLDKPESDFVFNQIRVTTRNGSERHPT